MNTRWAIVADQDRARIFARVAGVGSWQDIRDIDADDFGRVPSDGRETRSPKDPTDRPRNGSFAERLAREANSARKRGDFEELVIVAPGPLLETIRDNLDAATRRKLLASHEERWPLKSLASVRKSLGRRW